MGNRDLFDWFSDVAITSSGLGLTDPYYKRNLDIVQQVPHRRLARKVCSRRVGQRIRRERHRIGDAGLRLL